MATAGCDVVTELDAWITIAKNCGAPAVTTLTSGLDGGRISVRAILTEP